MRGGPVRPIAARAAGRTPRMLPIITIPVHEEMTAVGTVRLWGMVKGKGDVILGSAGVIVGWLTVRGCSVE